MSIRKSSNFNRRDEPTLGTCLKDRSRRFWTTKVTPWQLGKPLRIGMTIDLHLLATIEEPFGPNFENNA
jgi:hypothetical protein